MIQTYSGSLVVYYGNKHKQINLEDIKRAAYVSVFDNIIHEMSLKHFVVLNQQHTSIGMQVNNSFFNNQHSLYEHVGDFLITNKKNCGLAVLTADCLPIIMHDIVNNVIGIAHAGWKGSSLAIAEKMFMSMQHEYSSLAKDIHVYYGVNAQSCCYEVKNDFVQNFLSYEYAVKAFIKSDNRLYFDNKKFTTLQLQKVGIPLKNIYNTYESCTICSREYCSARREKEQAGRQLTVVALV